MTIALDGVIPTALMVQNAIMSNETGEKR